MLPSDVSLGMVIFGRVASFPWWPAIVSPCPRTELWVKDAKFWVFFFNDNSGAWLKTSEIRTFDSYNRDFCLEYNTSNVKFKRYQDRIQKAVNLAEEHVSRSISKIRIPILRNTPDDDSDSSERSDPVPTKKVNPRPKYPPSTHKPSKTALPRKASTRRRKSTSLSRLSPEHKDTPLQQDYEVVETIDGDHAPNDSRPQRKRVRSTRYEEYMAPFDEKNANRRRSSTPSPAVEQKCGFEAKKKRSSTDGSFPLCPLESFNYWSPPRKTMKKSKSTGSECRDLPSEFQLGEKGKAGSENTSKECIIIDDKESVPSEVASLEGRATKPLTRRQTRESQRRSSRNQKQKPQAVLTREMYISELTNFVRPKLTAKQTHDESQRVPKVNRVVLSRAGRTAGDDDVNKEVDGTDSETHPERERRRTAGCINVAAEDLIEQSMRGGHVNREICGTSSVAFGGSDLVSSILNRLSDLETDVKHLKRKALADEKATLGEDVTAAGLKSAVEALAAASAAFSNARDHDPGVISRALEVLWADGRFPLTGADGDLLRTVARSLVLATCKRKMSQVSEENECLMIKTGATPLRPSPKRQRTGKDCDHHYASFQQKDISGQGSGNGPSRAIAGDRSESNGVEILEDEEYCVEEGGGSSDDDGGSSS